MVRTERIQVPKRPDKYSRVVDAVRDWNEQWIAAGLKITPAMKALSVRINRMVGQLKSREELIEAQRQLSEAGYGDTNVITRVPKFFL